VAVEIKDEEIKAVFEQLKKALGIE